MKIVGVKAGMFTLLTEGHVYAFEYAKNRCDYLIVLTVTDDRVQKKKGCVPLPLKSRMRILSSLRCVDEVDSYTQMTEECWVRDFKEKRLYQEFDEDARLVVFHDPEVANNPACREVADELHFIERIPSSVTDIFSMIRNCRPPHKPNEAYFPQEKSLPDEFRGEQ